MAELKKGVYTEKATGGGRKLRLKGQLRAKAAEMAKRSEEAHRRAEKAIYELRSKSL